MKKILLAAAALAAPVGFAHPAFAAAGDPVKIGEGITIDPQLEARLRSETVDTPLLDASAVTLRARAGIELAVNRVGSPGTELEFAL